MVFTDALLIFKKIITKAKKGTTFVSVLKFGIHKLKFILILKILKEILN